LFFTAKYGIPSGCFFRNLTIATVNATGATTA